MKRSKIQLIIVLFMVTITMGTSPAADLNTSLVPADAQWVVNIDISKFLKTNIWNTIFNTEVKGGDFLEKKAEIEKKLNFYILKDLWGITIYGKKKQSKDAVVLLHGNFDRDRILDTIKEEKGKLTEEKYGKHLIYQWNSDDYGVFVNKKLALISHNKDAVRSALEVISGKVKDIRSGNLYKEIKNIKGNPLFYAVAGDISEITGNHGTPFIMKQAKNFVITADETANNLNLMLKLDTANEEAAKNIQQVASGLIALAKMNKGKIDENIQILEALQFFSKGNELRAKISVPIEFITKKIAEKDRYKRRKNKFEKKKKRD